MLPKQRHHGCRIRECVWRGHTLVMLENELLRVTILVSKGADIVEFRHKPTDIDVLWHTARGMPAANSYVPETAGGWDVFFDFFVGGWQESFPTGNTFGAYKGAGLTIHGEVSVLPWDCTILKDEADEISVAFEVECRRMPFRLRRVMTLRRNESSVGFDEKAENLAGQPMEYAWGHHPTFGPPFLTPDCVVDLPPGVVSTRPAGLHPKPRLKQGHTGNSLVVPNVNGTPVDLRRVPPAQGGTMDNYEIKLAGEGFCALRNSALNLGFGLTWDADMFPYLWEWEVSQGWDSYPLWSRDYLLALEPFNCPVGGGLHTLADKGVLPVLQPGETRAIWLRAGFCDSAVQFRGEFLKHPARLPTVFPHG
jgi:hypothetical protein